MIFEEYRQTRKQETKIDQHLQTIGQSMNFSEAEVYGKT